ncbi:MAG: spore coat associated protein CotJA, partial [Firmicutes bacterium]|nr:spore coat associated protein CotJA [Bacillota bacterium]
MAYVPIQPWEIPFDPAESLQSGTIFPSLFLPFKGGACK